MKTTRLYTALTFIFLTFLSAGTLGRFELMEPSDSETRLNFRLDQFSMTETGRFQKFEIETAGKTTEAGMPELPVFSTMFQMEPGITYEVTYQVRQSSVMTDIDLLPSSGIEEPEPGQETADPDDSAYGTIAVYPQSNISISEPHIMRGLELAVVTLIPFSYSPQTRQLEIYEEVEIQVFESGTRPIGNIVNMPRSRTFEPLYESLIVNYEPTDRDEDFQQPAILYVCGGGSNGAINHPSFNDLVEWRHQRGWVVYTAHTGQTGSSSSNIKNYIEDAYETLNPPPEIVGLVGDVGGSFDIPTWYENWSWYSGEGDHPYSQLDGTDIFPEVLIGRISVNSSTDIANVINKTIAYEQAYYVENNWLEKAALVGDPTHSGLSTIITNQYIENMMSNYGFEDIRTNYGDGNYSSWMQSQLNEGIAYFNYRGYIGTSGFGTSNINNANNGYMTPFVTFLTCSTGGFSGTAITESFLRAGTVASPKGGVAAIGTATSGTHTLYNNIVQMGIYEGIFSRGLETAGGALASGKLALYNAYPNNPDDKVSIFTHWNNLMGDPGLHLWTDTPLQLIVEHAETVGAGTNIIDVLVTDTDGIPVEDAWVTLLADDDAIFTTVLTNSEGLATLPLNTEYTGDVLVTVTKKNVAPSQTSFDISSDGPAVNIVETDITVDDSAGNNDGILNPGETVTLTIAFANYGNEPAENVVATISSDNELVEFQNTSSTFEFFDLGQLYYGNYEFTLAAEAVQNEALGLRIDMMDAGGVSGVASVPMHVNGAKLEIDGYSVVGQDYLLAGVSNQVRVELYNEGMVSSENVQGYVISHTQLLDVETADLSWNSIESLGSAESSQTFSVYASNDIIRGSILSLEIELWNDAGYDRSVILNLQVGEVTVMDPLGPDAFGHYIYDSEDLNYSLAVPYDWIEIDPSLGGDGTSLNLNDQGYGNPVSQLSAHLDIPFTFTFYGVDYTEISVSSNGWISFGDVESESFRNYPLPGPGGPSPMVAVFWDDLKTSGGGQAYSYIDEDAGIVIIEWSDMHTYDNNSPETFQIILIDAISPTGDDEMILQYKDFNNTTTGNLESGGVIHGSHCTVGIENHLGTDGLLYTYDDEYPEAALEITDETALFITTRQPLALLKGDVNQDGGVDILDIVLVVNDIVNITPLGPLELYIADMDENGIVNILDVIQMINNIVQ